MDWRSIDGNPVLQISSGRLAQQRCLPIPEQLIPLWQQCSGSGEAPLWADSTARTPQLLARRWADGLRRSSFCNATDLRQECARQWRQQGVSEAEVRERLGVGKRARMLHCPTETTQPDICT